MAPPDYDVVIVGSGAGGGAAAMALARAGQRVLVVERSAIGPEQMHHQDEHRLLVEREASFPEGLEINGRRQRPLVGSTLGGSTSLYGAALVRPAAIDFEPGRSYGQRLGPAQQRWPIDYRSLEPYYRRAEDLYQVAGDAAAQASPLAARSAAYPRALPPLEPINAHIAGRLSRGGLRPHRLPLAIDFDRCRRCPTCPGYYCPHGARRGSWSATVEPALASGAEVWRGATAERLIHRGGSGQALVVRREQGAVEIKADRFLIAASATQTPALLLRSALPDRSGQLGRNLMMHLGVLGVALFARQTGAATRLTKQLGWSDWYLGTRQIPHKLGYVQAIPIPGPQTMRAKAGGLLPLPLARALLARNATFALTIEDLPRPSNRVTLDADGRARLTHAFDPYDLERGRVGARLLARTLRKAHPLFVMTAVGARETGHLAHQVGTARMADDPRDGVVDRHGRVHGTDNIFVVDGSWLPTSLGVGPALTIVANALRVADDILGGRA